MPRSPGATRATEDVHLEPMAGPLHPGADESVRKPCSKPNRRADDRCPRFCSHEGFVLPRRFAHRSRCDVAIDHPLASAPTHTDHGEAVDDQICRKEQAQNPKSSPWPAGYNQPSQGYGNQATKHAKELRRKTRKPE